MFSTFLEFFLQSDGRHTRRLPYVGSLTGMLCSLLAFILFLL